MELREAIGMKKQLNRKVVGSRLRWTHWASRDRQRERGKNLSANI